MDDQGLHRIEVVFDQGHDVSVAAEFAEQRLCMPDHQVGRLRPGEAGVGGEQRPTFVATGGGLGGPAGQRGGPRHLRAIPRPNRACAAARHRQPTRRASSTSAGEAALQAEGIADLTSAGLKL